jgi:hypothetical protein
MKKSHMKVVPSHTVKFWTTRAPYTSAIYPKVYPKSVAYITGEHPQDQHFIYKAPADIRLVPVTRKRVADWRSASLTDVSAA